MTCEMKKLFEALSLVLVASVLFCPKMNAQIVKGHVFDENNAPMEFATVAASLARTACST